MSSSTVVSAPGKVLIAGGYLVLDPRYSGLVVSTSSRFYTVITPATTRGLASRIRVRSPQFIDAEWTYAVTVRGDGNVDVEPASISETAGRNKFVHLALKETLTLISELNGAKACEEILANGLDVAVVGDNDFYSQRNQLRARNLPATLASLDQIPAFAPTGTLLSQVHKTGLGSSAALITSLTSALLLHFGAVPASSLSGQSTEGQALAHNLAQYVHCLAQGKIGSGFDVSSAIFGSHIYTRFDPEVLGPLMNGNRDGGLTPTLSSSNPAWTYKVQRFSLPPGTRLLLADVDAGSDTPSLVGKVLKWRSNNPESANNHWDKTSDLNMLLAATLSQLSDLHNADKDAYTSVLETASSLSHDKWLAGGTSEVENEAWKTLISVHQLTDQIRSHMRVMGEFAAVPIEPPEQTALLNASISLPGVLGGGVPGAGGYDAIWLLVLDRPDGKTLGQIEDLWQNWKGLDVSPLSAVENRDTGIRIENSDENAALKAAVERR